MQIKELHVIFILKKDLGEKDKIGKILLQYQRF